MTAFAARVLRTVRAQGVVSPGARLGVAVSGGPDSTALLLVMLELAPTLGVTVDCVIHVNHGLRGQVADDDEKSVEALSAACGVGFERVRVDVAAHARRHGCSVEAAGHRLRRQAFEAVGQARGLDAVATGHTLDDQAETILMRLIRGAAARGLRGMSPRRGLIIRPLLATPRRAVEAYLVARGVTARDDASNRDLTIPRNRIRHELLPLLEARFSPRIRESLGRMAAHVAVDDDEFLAQASAVTARFEAGEGAVSVPAGAVAAVTRPVRRRVAQAALAALGVPASAGRIERLEAAMTGSGGPSVTIGAITVSNHQGRMVVARAGGRNGPPRRGIVGSGAGGAELLPGQVARLGPWDVSADEAVVACAVRPAGEVAIDAEQVVLPLTVRGRRPGDRLRPLGAAGRRKVQDIFVDRKVPRASRDTTPIVVDALGRIVWVAGHVVAHDARVTATTTRMLLLTLRPAGGAV